MRAFLKEWPAFVAGQGLWMAFVVAAHESHLWNF